MRKREADNIPRVEIKELRAAGFFSGKELGGVLCRSPFDGGLYRFVISNVFIDKIQDALSGDITPGALEGAIEFKSVMRIFSGEHREDWTQVEDPPIWQSVALCTTPCNYGKVRYWFRCPGLKGKACRDRVGVLYWLDGRLACRKCHNLTYKVRNIPQKERGYGRIIPIDQIDAMWASLKKYSYRGKPTKRFLRVQKKTANFNKALERAGATPEKIQEVMEKETIK